MSDMKNTNTEWLKEIPYHWGLSKINALYTLRNQKVSDRDYPPLSVTMKGILPQLDTAAKTNAHDDRKLVMKGDFAINSRSDRRGSCGISDYDGSVSLINTVMKPNGEMDPGYYNWLFHTTEFADEFYKWGHGIVDDLWTTNWQDMKHIDVPVPPLSEQHRIADFLDSKCSQIDEISKKIQEEIDTLEEYKKSVITEAVTKGLNPNVEMKDSGIEWIGKIPANWTVQKINYVARSISDIDHFMPKDYEASDSIPYIMIGDLDELSSLIDFDKAKQISPEDYNLLSRKSKTGRDDVIFARYATIGTVCYVDTERDFLVSYACLTIKTNSMMSGKYMYYYFKSSAFLEDVSQYINSNTQGNVGKDSLSKTKITVPPISLQKEIAKYLDSKISILNGSIISKQQQLSTLEEYKKSLIYEYVTGKKEVPDGNA